MNYPPNKNIEISNVIMKANVICRMFFIIDSFETIPKKTPSKIIQTRIIENDIIKINRLAYWTHKNGIKGIKPPKKGEPPFIQETTILAKFSAFCWSVTIFLAFFLNRIFPFVFIL